MRLNYKYGQSLLLKDVISLSIKLHKASQVKVSIQILHLESLNSTTMLESSCLCGANRVSFEGDISVKVFISLFSPLLSYLIELFSDAMPLY